MTDSGWVKLWRKSLKSGLPQNLELWGFFCWCLLQATHQPCKVMVGYQEVHLKPGQFIFGRKKAAREFGISESKVKRLINSLKATNRLTVQATNKFSIITIINWDTYQGLESESDRQSDRQSDQRATGKRPASDHKQECKEHKNVRSNKNIHEVLDLFKQGNFEEYQTKTEAHERIIQKIEALLIAKFNAETKRELKIYGVKDERNGFLDLYATTDNFSLAIEVDSTVRKKSITKLQKSDADIKIQFIYTEQIELNFNEFNSVWFIGSKLFEGKKKEQIDYPDWLNQKLWNEFKAHRRRLGKPMTPHAEKLTLNKIEKFMEQGHQPDDLINLAIEKGWQGIYPPKNGTGQQQQNSTLSPKQQHNARVLQKIKEDLYGGKGV